MAVSQNNHPISDIPRESLSDLVLNLTNTTAWLDLAQREELWQLIGPEAPSFLQQYNTQEVLKLSDYQSTYGAFLTQKGKLVSDVFIFKQPDGFWLLFSKGYGQSVADHLRVYLDFAEVELHDLSEKWGHYLVLGASAQGKLENILGEKLHGKSNQLQSFSFLNHAVWMTKTQRWGIEAWEVFFKPEVQSELTQKLTGQHIEAITAEVLEVYRIEAGLPYMGVDMTANHLVAEVGLDRSATSFEKGCYLGQETTARVDSRGHVNRHLQSFLIDQFPELPLPWPICQQGQELGQITSAVFSPQYQAFLGLGMISQKADSEIPLSLQVQSSSIEVQLLKKTQI